MQVTIAEWTRRHPFRTSTRNGHRWVSSDGAHGRHWDLTNDAIDDVMINQWKGKLSDNLETARKEKGKKWYILRQYLHWVTLYSMIVEHSVALNIKLHFTEMSPESHFHSVEQIMRTPNYRLLCCFIGWLRDRSKIMKYKAGHDNSRARTFFDV